MNTEGKNNKQEQPDKQPPAAPPDPTVEIPEPYRPILSRLMAIEQEGALMQERLQASVAIELGKLASGLKAGLVRALAQAAGKPLCNYELAKDFSEMRPAQAGPMAMAGPVPPAAPAPPAADPNKK